MVCGVDGSGFVWSGGVDSRRRLRGGGLIVSEEDIFRREMQNGKTKMIHLRFLFWLNFYSALQILGLRHVDMVGNPFIQFICLTSDTKQNVRLSNLYLPELLPNQIRNSDTKENVHLSNLYLPFQL